MPAGAAAWHTRLVTAGGLRWRVRRGGEGPVLLLLHGTGASLESWQACADLLAAQFDVLMPDLPGHAGSGGWVDGQVSLARMAQSLAALLDTLRARPALVAGHSAGAAVMLQWALHPLHSTHAANGAHEGSHSALRGLLSVNGALQPLQGLAGLVFPPVARLLRHRPWLPLWVARHARDRHAVRRFVAATGSMLDDAGIARYQQLLLQPGHVAGALAMMAGWRVEALQSALGRLTLPLWLVTGAKDRTVPPAQARTLAARVPGTRLHELPGLGHLAHEEAPEAVAALVRALWAEVDGMNTRR